MYIKFCGFNKKENYYKIDGKYIKLQSKDDFEYIDFNAAAGKHTLEIIPKTFYSNPACYLNCLSPILYIWLLKFFDSRSEKQTDIYKTSIYFEIDQRSQKAPVIELIKNADGSIKCTDKSFGISKKIDRLQTGRRKMTYILSSILYMLFFNGLSIVDAVSSKNIQESILFCFLITLFSLDLIFQINRSFSDKK